MSIPTRRKILQAAATAAALLPKGSRAMGRAVADLRFGLIGCGQRGRHFFHRAAYVCDPDQEHLANAAKQSGVDARHAVTDLRRILDDKSIDAVVIATPDHWHAPAAILACEAGKHVYVEKPCSHNFRESQLLLAAARRNNVVVQHGTQQRSRPFAIDAISKLRDGVIGDVLMAKAWNVQRRANIGHAQPSTPPKQLDYDLYVGPAEMTPFQSNRFHQTWRWWYNFGTGDLGNDGAHEFDCARWGLGIDTLPTKIAALGGKYAYDDDQQFPDTATCVFEYPGAGRDGKCKQLVFEMRLWSKNYPHNCDSGVEFYGAGGTMMLSKRGKMLLFDENNKLQQEIRPEPEEQLAHLENMFTAIQDGVRPSADVQEGLRSMALPHLANIAIRTGRSLTFDPAGECILDDEQAQGLLSRKYRQDGHWAIPSGLS